MIDICIEYSTLDCWFLSVYIWVMVTSNTKGDIAELKAQLRATELGYTISIPNHHCRYDLVLDDGHKLWRVQVKYANGKPSNSDGSVVVKLEYNDRTKHSYTYNALEIDALVVYLPKIDKLCWFPPNVYVGKKRLSIRVDKPKNGQVKHLVVADKYYW